MFWISLFGLAVGFALFRLGALTVWVAVLTAALKLAAAVAGLLVGLAAWRLVARYRTRSTPGRAA